MRGTEVSEFIDSAYTWQERATKAEAEVERLRNRLSKIEDMCVEFHECGPYQEGEEVKRIMAIYDMAGGIEK